MFEIYSASIYLYTLIFIFLGMFALLNFFYRYPFVTSFLVSFAVVSSVFIGLTQSILWGIWNFFAWSCALSIYEDGLQLKVPGKLWFSVFAFAFPVLGIPFYLMLRKKLSPKYGKTLKGNLGKITFYNR